MNTDKETGTRIVVNAEVRRLLAELDQAFARFHEKTEFLARKDITNSQAINAGAEREHVKAAIAGIAWQINKASTGKTGMGEPAPKRVRKTRKFKAAPKPQSLACILGGYKSEPG